MYPQQGGGGQPSQGPRRLLKQRAFPKDGPVMTSTPYQGYPTAPAPGFNMTPQPSDNWSTVGHQNYQNNQYNYGSNPEMNYQPMQTENIMGQPAFMTPQQQYPQAPGFVPYANAMLGQGGYADLINNPLVTNVVKEYGKNLIGNAGNEMLARPVSQLKYYFAVDNRYVLKKLKLILFPFFHKDWAITYQDNQPVQPRLEINAPDLYIPVMAYVTYVLLAGLVLGIQDRFSPEKLGMHASSAFACTSFEIIVLLVFLYLANVQSTLRIFDLIAYSGYKYVGIILAILVGQVFQWTGYLICIVYSGLALAFFIMRSFKFRVTESTAPATQQQITGYDMYGQEIKSAAAPPQSNMCHMYFIVFVALAQPIFMTWVSYHLIGSHINPNAKSPPL